MEKEYALVFVIDYLEMAKETAYADSIMDSISKFLTKKQGLDAIPKASMNFVHGRTVTFAMVYKTDSSNDIYEEAISILEDLQKFSKDGYTFSKASGWNITDDEPVSRQVPGFIVTSLDKNVRPNSIRLSNSGLKSWNVI